MTYAHDQCARPVRMRPLRDTPIPGSRAPFWGGESRARMTTPSGGLRPLWGCEWWPPGRAPRPIRGPALSSMGRLQAARGRRWLQDRAVARADLQLVPVVIDDQHVEGTEQVHPEGHG